MTRGAWLGLCALGVLSGVGFVASAACLDPLASDVVERPGLILPPDAEVPDLDDNPVMHAQIERNDGVDDGGTIPLRSAFAHGKRIWYWDMGPASPSAIPLYVLVRKDDAGTVNTPQGNYAMIPGHPSIFDAVPGDAGYSPWWILVLWPVTDKYQGETITSFDAMDEAFREGLVGPSIMLPVALDCPIVLPGTRLQTVPDDPSSGVEGFEGYYKGSEIYYFTFDVAPLHGSTIATPAEYVLRREGGEPLSEALRGVDMTGDGDLLDSNDLFAAAPGDDDYTGLTTLVDAVVTDHDHLIDESHADDRSDLDDAAQLFDADGDPDPTHLVALHDETQSTTSGLTTTTSAVVMNRPIWHPAATP